MIKKIEKLYFWRWLVYWIKRTLSTVSFNLINDNHNTDVIMNKFSTIPQIVCSWIFYKFLPLCLIIRKKYLKRSNHVLLLTKAFYPFDSYSFLACMENRCIILVLLHIKAPVAPPVRSSVLTPSITPRGSALGKYLGSLCPNIVF